MSLKNSYTTSDYLQWDTATTLVRKLYRDKNYRFSLLIGCGIFFGLRISDLLRLNWNMLLNKEAKFVLIEKKTGKRREVKINREFQKHIKDCYQALAIKDMEELCFKSGRNKAYSIQWINLILKELKYRYNLKINHFSTHSLRKTFGYWTWHEAEDKNKALVVLQQIFNHSSILTTSKYIGLVDDEIKDMYNSIELGIDMI